MRSFVVKSSFASVSLPLQPLLLLATFPLVHASFTTRPFPYLSPSTPPPFRSLNRRLFVSSLRFRHHRCAFYPRLLLFPYFSLSTSKSLRYARSFSFSVFCRAGRERRSKEDEGERKVEERVVELVSLSVLFILQHLDMFLIIAADLCCSSGNSRSSFSVDSSLSPSRSLDLRSSNPSRRLPC